MITPKEYVGSIMELAQQRRGEYVDMQYLTETRTTLVYNMPLAEVGGWLLWYGSCGWVTARGRGGCKGVLGGRAPAAACAAPACPPCCAGVSGSACVACKTCDAYWRCMHPRVWLQVVTDFFDALKSRSRGYASMEYSITGWVGAAGCCWASGLLVAEWGWLWGCQAPMAPREAWPPSPSTSSCSCASRLPSNHCCC